MTTSPGLGNRALSRSSLRYATFIDPQTGTRHKDAVKLLNFSGMSSSSDTENDNPRDPPPEANTRQEGRFDLWSKSKENFEVLRQFVVSDTGKGVLKCAIAYTLGTLATFVPGISTLLGHNDSKHLVATITVYFHPHRSLGSMLDAMMLATIAFTYTAVVSILSMSITVFFNDTLHLLELGHAIVLIIFLGGGLGFLMWVKLIKGNPLVNVSCSLASLGIVTVITKEGAIQVGDYSFVRISQILKMIIAGVIPTILVSFLIFPISGRRRFKQNMIDVTDSLADMLALITSSFLSGDEDELESPSFTSVSKRHMRRFATIRQKLKESKYEHYLLGTERHASVEKKLVQCVQRISQSVGGLRSAASMQFEVIKQIPKTSPPRLQRNFSSFNGQHYIISESMNSIDNVISPTSEVNNLDEPTQSQSNLTDSPTDFRNRPRLNTPSQIFDLFIDQLGPSMRSLAFTLKEILDDLPFDANNNYAITFNPKFQSSLERALELYRNARKEALNVVSNRQNVDRVRPLEVQADWEEAAACCGHFSSSLLEVAEEIKNYLLILDEMQLEITEFPSARTWSWLKVWQLRKDETQSDETQSDVEDPEFTVDLDRVQSRPPLEDYDLTTQRKGSWILLRDFRKRMKQRIFLYVHKVTSFFRREDIRFGLKVGIGAILYALPSFIPSTRPFYSRWRGEWGLLAYMLTCSMTIGAANTTGYSRMQGTCAGAALAIVAWEISNDNPIVLCSFGFVMAYWTAYLILAKGKGPMGRFIMLTYNLSALYAYSLTVLDDENDGDEEDKSNNPLIFSITWHRVAAVLVGTMWGLIITRVVWPISAREKIKEGIALLWLRMGLIWKRDPLSILTKTEHPNRYMDLREERDLQSYLIKLQSFAESAKSEFEFKGPFQYEVYSKILNSTSRMLDAFHTMNVVMLKDLKLTPGEEALLKATDQERLQLCSRISHLFSVLASSMKLEYPMANDALPNIEHTRDRLLARVFKYRADNAQTLQTADDDFGLLCTYALVTGQLGLEIDNILKELELLFGVLDEEALRLE